MVQPILTSANKRYGWKPGKRASVVLLIFFAALLAYLLLPTRTVLEPQPTYKGWTLSEWLHEYMNSQTPLTNSLLAQAEMKRIARHEEAYEAIQQIGTNALPALISMLRYEDAPRTKFTDWLFYRPGSFAWLPDWMRGDWLSHLPKPGIAHDNHVYAEVGFQVLGPLAIPVLQQALNDDNREVRETATNLSQRISVSPLAR